MNIFKKITPILSVLVLILSVYVIVKIAPLFLEKLSGGFRKSLVQAPDFVLKDAGDNLVKLSDFRGRKVILSFWTSWNSISLEQIRILNDYAPTNKNLSVLALNNQEGMEVIRPISDKNSNVVALIDEEGLVGELYDISVLPLTIFIDENGFVVNKVIGTITFGNINKLVSKL